MTNEELNKKMKIKTVDNHWLERRAKAIETRNLKSSGHSLTWVSILNNLNQCIACIYEGENSMDIDYDEYVRLRNQERLR